MTQSGPKVSDDGRRGVPPPAPVVSETKAKPEQIVAGIHCTEEDVARVVQGVHTKGDAGASARVTGTDSSGGSGREGSDTTGSDG